MIGKLLQAEADGDRLTQDELLSTLVLLLEGGENTSGNLLGTMMHVLLDHPEEFNTILSDSALIANAIEEVLRFNPVNHVILRRVRVDAEIGGHSIPAGKTVICVVTAANRDPEVFVEPDRFDIYRVNARRHLSLGTGIHFCLGAWLGRAEAAITLEAVLDALPGLHRSATRDYLANRGFNDHGPACLPVEWNAG